MVSSPPARPDPILFDLDGTLTDSAPGILACLRHALQAVGHPGLPEPTLARFLGPPLADSLSTEAGLAPDQVAAAIAAYRERFAVTGMFQNSVYPGMVDLLATLRSDGRVLALATSKPEVFATRILTHFELVEFFEVVVGSELDGRRNAKAEVVSEALRRLGHPARADVVMIGDRSHDVLGAHANGLACIGVGWGYAAPGELAQAGAAAIAPDPRALGALLGIGRHDGIGAGVG